MLTYFLLDTLCRGTGCALLIFTEIGAYVLLAGHALRGEALRPPPCTPPPAFILWQLPWLPTLTPFFSEASFLWVHLSIFGFLIVWPLPLLPTRTPGSVLRGEALRPPPRPLFFFDRSLCYLLSLLPPAPPHPLLFFWPLPLLPTPHSWVRIAGGGAAPWPPSPAFFFDSSLCYLLSLPFLQNIVSLGSSVTISTETCAYVLLAGYALRGEALRPPPCTPPPAFIFLLGSPYYLLSLPFSQNIVSLSSSVTISTETCAISTVDFLLTYFIAGGGASAPSPLHPPTRFFFFRPLPLLHTLTPASVLRGEALRPDPPTRFFFCQLPLLPTLTPFFTKHGFFGFICNNIHRDLCLRTSCWVRIAGGGAAPSPLHPPSRFYFLLGSPCYLLSLHFFGSSSLHWYPSRLPRARPRALPRALLLQQQLLLLLSGVVSQSNLLMSSRGLTIPGSL